MTPIHIQVYSSDIRRLVQTNHAPTSDVHIEKLSKPIRESKKVFTALDELQQSCSGRLCGARLGDMLRDDVDRYIFSIAIPYWRPAHHPASSDAGAVSCLTDQFHAQLRFSAVESP
ncbi:hypothetical protein [Methylocystis echinoides]|uniref:hypothetical protein n=1 Tax=Methylocystis echinoides TaxID=29468 RepID=UPI0034214D00